MYDELDERTVDEKRRELEREKKKRRRKNGFIIGIIGAVVLTFAFILGAAAYETYRAQTKRVGCFMVHPPTCAGYPIYDRY